MTTTNKSLDAEQLAFLFDIFKKIKMKYEYSDDTNLESIVRTIWPDIKTRYEIRDELEMKDDVIETYQNRLNEKDETINQLMKTIAKRDEEISELKKKLKCALEMKYERDIEFNANLLTRTTLDFLYILNDHLARNNGILNEEDFVNESLAFVKDTFM